MFLFGGAFFRRPAIICGACFLTMLSLYFLLNWTPKVLVDQGFSLRFGISGSMLMNLGGVAGGLLLGLATRRFGPRARAIPPRADLGAQDEKTLEGGCKLLV